MKVIEPIFRKEAGKVIGALSGIDPGVIEEQATSGTIKVEIGADVFEIPADAVAIEREVVLGGRYYCCDHAVKGREEGFCG